ncbi:MAG: hypothetical protein HYY43_04495 [Deltaproteobacteria bacterium]|nr:hypothetical protein [Deltaproteobacteria bacterium]
MKFSYTAEIQSSDLFNVTEILSNAKSAEVRAALRSIVSQKSNATNINLKNFIVDNYFKDDKLKSGEELGALLQIREGWNELLSTFSLYADKDVMAFENAMIDRAFSLRKRNIEFNDGATEFFRELTAFADFIMKIKDDVPDKVSLQMKTIENLMSRRIVGANEELYTFLQSIVISGSLDERIVRKAIHCMKDLPVENDKIDDAETLEYAGRMRALWGMGLRNLASHKHEVLIGFQNILFNRAFSLECEDQDNQKKLNHELALFTQFIMKLDADLPGIAGFQMKALDRITERNYSDTDMFDILSEIIEKGKPCFDAAGKILKMAGHLNIDETVKRNFRARVLVAMNTMPASPFSLSDLFIDLLKKYAVPENGLQALSDMMGKPLISDDLELIITEWPNINISANRAAVLDALYNSGIPADRVKKRLYRHEGLIDKMIATNGTSRREWAALGRVLNKYGFIDSIDTLFYEKFEAVKDDAVKSINYGSAVGAMKLVRAGDSLIDLFWSETAIANIEVRHAVIISLAELDSRNEGKGGRLLKLEKDAGHVAVRWAELYEECMKRVETDGVAYQVLKRRISTPK